MKSRSGGREESEGSWVRMAGKEGVAVVVIEVVDIVERIGVESWTRERLGKVGWLSLGRLWTMDGLNDRRGNSFHLNCARF